MSHSPKFWRTGDGKALRDTVRDALALTHLATTPDCAVVDIEGFLSRPNMVMRRCNPLAASRRRSSPTSSASSA